MKGWSLVPLILVAGTSRAQVYFGNRAGVSIGKEVLKEADGYEGENIHDEHTFQLLGGNAALTLEFPLSDRVSLQTDIGYVEKGYLQPEETGGTPDQRLLRLGYGDLSLLVKWTALSGNTRPEIFAGPDVGRLLRARDETWPAMLVMETGEFQSTYPDFSEADHLAPWEVSLVAGAGFIIQTGTARFHVNYRYVYGLSNIYRYVVDFTTVNGAPLGTGSMFNRTHLITFGYSIPLSREAWTGTPAPR